MSAMLDILGITSPIFLIVFLGYVLTHRGVFDKAGIRAVGSFVVNLALPALVFKALSGSHLRDILNASYLFAYVFGSGLALIVGYVWGWFVADRKPLACTFYAMGSSCANSGFVGYPILMLTLPSVAGVTLALNMMVENLLVIPLVIVMAEHGQHGAGGWAALKKLAIQLATTPLILAMVAGLAVSMAELKVPAFFGRTVEMIAAASGALSLFVIGGALAGLPVRGMGRAIVPIVLGKLVIHPLGVVLGLVLAAAIGLTPISPELRMAAILSAAMPMMSIYATLALKYGQEQFAAVAQLLATILSFFTLSGLLWLFSRFA